MRVPLVAVQQQVDVATNCADRRSDSTIAAALAASIGRYSRVTRLRATSRCGASSRASTEDWTLPRGAVVMDQVTL